VTAEDTVITRAADQCNPKRRHPRRDPRHHPARRLPPSRTPFTVAEARTAREAFLTSTTADLLAVVRIDGAPVADGKPGPLSRKLREAYFHHAAAAA
jgi:D-alanine transaminase